MSLASSSPNIFVSLPAPAAPKVDDLSSAAALVLQAVNCLRSCPVRNPQVFRDACAWAATSPLLGGSTASAVLTDEVHEAWEAEMVSGLEKHPGVRARRLWCHELMRTLWALQDFPAKREEATKALSLVPDWRRTPWLMLDPKAPVTDLVPHITSQGSPGRLMYFAEALSQWLVYRLPALSLKDIVYTGPRSSWITPDGIKLLIPDAIDETRFDQPQQKTLANDRSVLLELAGSNFREASEFWATMLYARIIAQEKNPQTSLVEAITQQGAFMMPLFSHLNERTWLGEDPGGLLLQAIPGFGQWARENRSRWDLQDLQSITVNRLSGQNFETARTKSVRM